VNAPRGTYWESVLEDWVGRWPGGAWRAYCDALNLALLKDWLGSQPLGSALKTDLFEEAVGSGLVPLLLERCANVTGVDIAEAAVNAAVARNPALSAQMADVRALPFADGAFDLVVSTSTLDHFDGLRDIAAALAELHRVLAASGKLVLTLDNKANPVVALRGVLPFWLLHRLGLVPYRSGTTCGPARLRRLLEEAGFDVVEMGAVMHSPRVLANRIAQLRDRGGGGEASARIVRGLLRFERLRALPTRWLTGYYIAVLARPAGR
jgi:SAM-dependent methyltransferase